MTFRRAALVAISFVGLLAPVSLSLAACGDGTGTVIENGVETTTFASWEWGFSFRYPTRCVKSTPPIDKSSSPGTLFRVVIADPDGTVVDGTALDGFSVAVQEMSRAASAEDLETHRADFQFMARQLIGRPEDLHMTKGWELGSIGGRQALVVEYRFKADRHLVIARSYLVPVEKRLYWITAQSAMATQKATDLGVTIETFDFD